MPPRKLLFAVIALLYGLLSYLCPPMQDDFVFMGRSLGIEPGTVKMALGWAEVVQHFGYDVGRLSNVLATVFLCLFPRWVFGLAQAAVIYVALEYGCRLARIPEHSLRGLVWAAMWVLFLPWGHRMLILDFSINYVWPSAFIIYVLYEMFSAPRCRVRWWALLIALAAGWLHEQFSVAVCCGFLMVLLFRRSAVTRPRLAIALAFVAGTVLNFVFPGIWSRAAVMDRTMGNVLYDFIFCSMACLSFVVVPLLWKGIANDGKALAMVLVTAAFVAFVINLRFGNGRSLWAPQLFGCLGMIVCTAVYKIKLKQRIKNLLAWGVSGFLSVSLLLSAYWMYRLRCEFREVERQVLLTGSESVYYQPVEMPPVHDFLTFYRVPVRQFYGWYARYFFGAYYLDRKMLRPLPVALRGCTVGDVPETTPGSGLRYVGGCLVAAPELLTPYAGELFTIPELTFDDGSSSRREVDPVPFTDAEGRDWVYIDTSRRYRSDPGRIVGLR